MKNINKVLCLIIAITVLTTSLGVSAEYIYLEPYEYMDDIFIYDVGEFSEKHKPVQEGEDATETIVTETEHISMLNSFGIWDGAEKSVESIVTMSEFSVIVSRARLGVGNALEEVYIKDNDQTIVTYKDVLKYFLEGLGYYHRCAEFNYSDEAYLIVASQIELIGGSVSVPDISAAVTRAELAKIVCKALVVDICEKEFSSGGYSFNVVVGKNLLNTVHGIHDVSGFVNAVHGLSLYGNGNVREGHIEIDRADILAPEIDTMQYFGKRVTAFAKYDEITEKLSLISISEAADAESYEFDFRDIEDISGGSLTYITEDGEEELVDVSSVKYIIQNGGKLLSLSEIADYKNGEGKIILTASTKKGAIDSAVIWDYTYLVVKSNSSVSGRMTFGYNLTYKGNSFIEYNEHDMMHVVLDDKDATAQEIPNGSVIRLARSADGKYTEIVAYGKSKFLNSVSEVDEEFVVIEDIQYRISRPLQTYIDKCRNDITITGDDRIEPFVPGTKGTFYVFDDIIVTMTTAADYSYAYLRSAKLGRSQIDKECHLKMFTQDNEWKEYALADKITLDGKANVAREDFVSALTGEESEYASILDELVRYQANAEEEIVALDTIVESDDELMDDERIKLDYTYFGVWVSPDYTKGIKYSTGHNGIWFLLPDDRSDESSYSIGSPVRDSSNSQKLLFYSVDEFFRPRVGVASAGGTATLGGSRAGFYVKSSTAVLVDAEEQIYGYKLKGYELSTANGGNNVIPNRFVVITEEDYNKMGIKTGDLLDIPVGAEKVSSANCKVWAAGLSDPGTNDEQYYKNDYHLDSTATITNIDYENNLVMIKTNYNDSDITDHERLISYTRVIAEIDSAAQTVTKLSISDLEIGDRVFVSIRTGIGEQILKLK